MRIVTGSTSKAEQSGAFLVEAIVAMSIAGVTIAALAAGFYSLHRSSESAAYSLAANALAVQGYEQVRAAKWDALSYPNVDEVVSSNFPPDRIAFDMARSGTNIVYATNYTTITTISTNPLLKLVKVDCVYPFLNRGFVTNTIVAYRASETGQQNFQQSTAPASPTLPPTSGTTSITNERSGYTFTPATSTVTTSSGGTSSYGRYWGSYSYGGGYGGYSSRYSYGGRRRR